MTSEHEPPMPRRGGPGDDSLADPPHPGAPAPPDGLPPSASADRRPDEFLAALGHELRNPLAAIANALELWQHPGSAQRLDQIREVIARQALRLGKIVDDLQDLSRLGRGLLELRLETVELRAVVDRAVEAVRDLVGQRHHNLTVIVPPEPLVLEADPSRLEQALVNVLANAARYTPDGGRIDVQAFRRGGEIVISVRDNGIGMRGETLDGLFDVFARPSAAHEPGQHGLGLGLPLARHLVQMHRGTLAAASEGPGQGSTFTLRLPAAETPGTAGPRPAAADTDRPAAGIPRCRILVVDDDRSLRHIARVLLERQGHTVEVADSGRAAMERLEGFRPDVLLCDISLGIDMSGVEVARAVRQRGGAAAPLLLALSGYSADELGRTLPEGLFDGVLGKPLNIDTLHAAMARRTRRGET